MDYKLISIDLDDTLLNDHLIISQENLQAISYAHEKGVKIVFCTGRAINSVHRYLRQIESYSQQDYFIAFNGAVISSIQGEIIFKKEITKPYISKLVDIGKKEEVDIQMYSESSLYVDQYTNIIVAYEKMTGTKAEVLGDLKELDVTLKVLYNSDNPYKLEKIRNSIKDQYIDELNVFYSKKNYLEVLKNEANKGLALAFLADYLEVKREEVIAIGDSENDSFMVQYAGLGVCMKNGRDSLKQISQYVTQFSNNENGVAEVIYKYVK